MKGITTLSLTLCPDVQRTLSDAGVAEFILGAAGLTKRTALTGDLIHCLVVSEAATKRLDGALLRNI